MTGEFLERRIRIRRLHDVHQLHLFELVLANEAACVLARGACLGTKTRRVRDESSSAIVWARRCFRAPGSWPELRRWESGRNPVRRRRGTCLLRLSATVPCPAVRTAHHERNVQLRVAVLARVQVQHELRQGAMQPRNAALQHREARTGNLRGGLEIDSAQLFAERDVIQRLEVETCAERPSA